MTNNYGSMSYDELLEARAAGQGVSEALLLSARRREAAAEESAAEAKAVQQDLAKAAKAYNEKAAELEAEVNAEAAPLLEHLAEQRKAHAAAAEEYAKAGQTMTDANSALSSAWQAVADLVSEKLGEGQYPVDEEGNPRGRTYYRQRRPVVDGVIIGRLEDTPVEELEA